MPFHFLNQLLYGLITITILIYILSKYILPNSLKRYLVRLYIKLL